MTLNDLQTHMLVCVHGLNELVNKIYIYYYSIEINMKIVRLRYSDIVYNTSD